MFSTTELNGMRETQTAHMMDTCVIYHVTAKTKNSRGESVKTFDEGTPSICGVELTLNSRGESVTYGSSFIEADNNAVLRLPLGTVCDIGDEIEITARFGEPIKPIRFEVERFLNDGVSGRRAYLKLRTIA